MTYMPRATTIRTAEPRALGLDHAMACGTPVLTMDGELPVEFLTPGDRIITRSGARRLVSVEVTLVQNARVVRISTDTLGVDRPGSDLIVSPDQPVLVRDWRAKAMFGTATAMIAASKLTDGEYIRSEVLSEVRMYALRFVDDVVIYAAGLELECVAATVTA